MLKRLALALVLLAATPALAKTAPSCAIKGDSDLVYRLAWVEPGQYLRSGAVVVDGKHLAGEQPTDGTAVVPAYQMLKTKYHVGAVVNLRAESSEDAAAAKSLGLAYLHLPIADGVAPTAAQVVQFFRFLASERTHHVVTLWHCAGGIGRTGVLAGMLRLQQGWSTHAAADEMFGMGLSYDQADQDLPALNAFAAALGKPTYYPADWHGPRTAPFSYKAIAHTLPSLH